jgi:hypothetical protein
MKIKREYTQKGDKNAIIKPQTDVPFGIKVNYLLKMLRSDFMEQKTPYPTKPATVKTNTGIGKNIASVT